MNWYKETFVLPLGIDIDNLLFAITNTDDRTYFV